MRSLDLRALLLGFTVVACSSSGGGPPPDGGAPPSSAPPPSIALAFTTPIDGDLAEPGENVDLTLQATAPNVSPTLLVNDVETAVTWTPDAADPTVLRAPFTIPLDAAGALRFDALATDAVPAEAQLRLAAPASKGAGSASSSTDVTISLPSGAKLTIPKGVLPDGAAVTFASYPPATLPYFTALVSPIYRVHIGVDDPLLTGSLFLDEPLTAPAVAGLATNPHLSLELYEGDEPDSEGGPISIRPQISVAADGSGTARSELPPRAFHHTGSIGAVMGLENMAYPFVIDSPQVCASDDTAGGAPDCQALLRTYGGANTPSVGLPCPAANASPHVSVTGSIKWTDTPPAFQTPLDAAAALGDTPAPPYATDVLNPLRKHPTLPVWRYHEGADLRAKGPWPDPNVVGWPLHAAIAGHARAHMQSEYTLDIQGLSPADKWWVRNMHVSTFVGFKQAFSANGVLGKTLKTVNGKPKLVDVAAPADGTYALDCRQNPKDNGSTKAILICTVQRTDDPPPHWSADLYRLPEGTWVRDVAAGEVVAMTGHTASFYVPYHLHFEVWYGAIRGVHIDPAFFYDAVSRNKADNGDPSILQTPTLRLDALLTQRNQPNVFLGIDPMTLWDQPANGTPVACPYGGPAIGKYSLVKVHGPTAPATTVDWDLGPCVAKSVCDANNPVDVRVTLGTTTWRRASPNEYPNDPGGWNLLVYGGPTTTPPTRAIGSGNDVDEMTAWVKQTGSDPKPSDFEGMTVTVQGVNGEFSTSTMTVTNVVSVGSPASYMGSFNGPEAGNPQLLSASIPANATVLTFGDKVQPACVVGFPATFLPNNFANRCGRSNLIAYWKDPNTKTWTWAFNVSGGSYNSNGGFPQWHEYQFVFDSQKQTGMGRTRYDVFLGPNAAPPVTSSGWNYIRTAQTSVTVQFAKMLPYTLPTP